MHEAPRPATPDDLSVYRLLRRLVVAVLGLSVLLVGVALLVLPGPALLVIPVGLGILAIEFEWARRWLRMLKKRYTEIQESFGNGEEAQPKTSESKSTPIGQ